MRGHYADIQVQQQTSAAAAQASQEQMFSMFEAKLNAATKVLAAQIAAKASVDIAAESAAAAQFTKDEA